MRQNGMIKDEVLEAVTGGTDTENFVLRMYVSGTDKRITHVTNEDVVKYLAARGYKATLNDGTVPDEFINPDGMPVGFDTIVYLFQNGELR